MNDLADENDALREKLGPEATVDLTDYRNRKSESQSFTNGLGYGCEAII